MSLAELAAGLSDLSIWNLELAHSTVGILLILCNGMILSVALSTRDH